VSGARTRRPGARPGVALAIMLGAQLMVILDSTIIRANYGLLNNVLVGAS
jgi:hypothetical protein